METSAILSQIVFRFGNNQPMTAIAHNAINPCADKGEVMKHVPYRIVANDLPPGRQPVQMQMRRDA